MFRLLINALFSIGAASITPHAFWKERVGGRQPYVWPRFQTRWAPLDDRFDWFLGSERRNAEFGLPDSIAAELDVPRATWCGQSSPGATMPWMTQLTEAKVWVHRGHAFGTGFPDSPSVHCVLEGTAPHSNGTLHPGDCIYLPDLPSRFQPSDVVEVAWSWDADTRYDPIGCSKAPSVTKWPLTSFRRTIDFSGVGSYPNAETLRSLRGELDSGLPTPELLLWAERRGIDAELLIEHLDTNGDDRIDALDTFDTIDLLQAIDPMYVPREARVAGVLPPNERSWPAVAPRTPNVTTQLRWATPIQTSDMSCYTRRNALFRQIREAYDRFLGTEVGTRHMSPLERNNAFYAWQTEHEAALTELVPLKRWVAHAVRMYEASMRAGSVVTFDCDHPISTTDLDIQAWVAYYGEEEHHLTHDHTGSYISGVYYLQVGPDSNPLIFQDPRNLLGQSEEDLLYRHTPVENELVLFPSWLKHSVPSTYNAVPRIAIAFNVDGGDSVAAEACTEPVEIPTFALSETRTSTVETVEVGVDGPIFQRPSPLVFAHTLCPNLSDAELRRRFGDRVVEVEHEKKETRLGEGHEWSVRTFLDRYKHPSLYYLVTDLPTSWIEECTPFNLTEGGHSTEWLWWMSSGGTSSVLHQDDYQNINCVLEGTKKFRVAPPEWEASAYITEGPGYGEYSDVDPDDPDLDRYPKYAEIPFRELVVEAGRCIFLPTRWLHSVRSIADPQTGRSLAVNVWFH